MLDRQKLEALLANRFPGATPAQIAAAANAIMAMIRSAGNPAGDETLPPSVRGRRVASALPLPPT
jgi:hypothetical protein